MKKYAFVVVIFGGDSYVPGAVTIAQSLRNNGDDENADIVLMYTKDVMKDNKKDLLEIFEKTYTKCIEIDYIVAEAPVDGFFLSIRPFYSKVWTKLNVLKLVEYDKICLLDADYLTNKPISHLFKLDAPVGHSELPVKIVSCKKNVLNWLDVYSYFNKKYDRLPGVLIVIMIYLDVVFTSRSHFRYGGINASIMILKPGTKEFNNIIRDINNYSDDRTKMSYPEQQYLSLRYAFGDDFVKLSNPDYIMEVATNFVNDLIEAKLFSVFFEKVKMLSVKRAGNRDIKKNSIEKIFEIKSHINSCYQNVKVIHEISDDKKREKIINVIQIVLTKYYNDFEETHIEGMSNGWKNLGLEYFNTIYYDPINVNDKDTIGYPMLQGNKVWTVLGLENAIDHPHGMHQWYKCFGMAIKKINSPGNHYYDKFTAIETAYKNYMKIIEKNK